MRIGFVTPDQHESLVSLLCELNSYYHPDSVADRALVAEHAAKFLLPSSSPYRLVVATSTDGTVCGLAAVAITYSLVEPEWDKRAQCHLKELYVSATKRSGGVGRALMGWVARYARENGCHRIDWPVQATNAPGIAFYERLGARRVADRLSYRLVEPAIGLLAADVEPVGGDA